MTAGADRGLLEGLSALSAAPRDASDLTRGRRLMAEFAEVPGAPERVQESESVLARAREGDSL